MPVPMSARRANFPGSAPDVNALGPPLNDVEVPSPQALAPFERLSPKYGLVESGKVHREVGCGI
jgi:hypothetical protein